MAAFFDSAIDLRGGALLLSLDTLANPRLDVTSIEPFVVRYVSLLACATIIITVLLDALYLGNVRISAATAPRIFITSCKCTSIFISVPFITT